MGSNSRKKNSLVKFLLYLGRWQLSSPLLALCLIWLEPVGAVWATVIANLIGAIIMYPVDKFIFSSGHKRIRQDKNK